MKERLVLNFKKDFFLCFLFIGLLCCSVNLRAELFDSSTFWQMFDSEYQTYNYAPSSIVSEDGTVESHFYCSNKDSGIVVDYIYLRERIYNNGSWSWGPKTLVLEPGSEGAWDSVHVCDPAVIKGEFACNGTTYQWAMFYLAANTTACVNNEIGVAFANDLSGPWVKWEGNPIVPFGSYDYWGVGQACATSIDKHGRLNLFYTIGDGSGTRMVRREMDLSDMSAPVISDPVKLPVLGLTNIDGSTPWLNNANLVYDPDRQLYFVSKPRHPIPDDAGFPVRISEQLQIACAYEDSIVTGNGFWRVLGHIDSSLTGLPRNHNSGIMRDPYGWLPEYSKIRVIFAGGQPGSDWLWSYRLNSIEGTLVDPLIVCRTIYVDSDANGSNDGSSWANAYTNLQDAIADAMPGDQVWVAQGAYTPDQGDGYTAGDITASFALPASVEFYGGFAGFETAIDQRDWIANQTILSGDLNGNDGADFANYGDNSYHIIKSNNADLNTVLDGFVIKGGNANQGWPNQGGAALRIDGNNSGGDLDGSMTVMNCTFSANYCTDGGSAVWIRNTATTFTNCTFAGNKSNKYAGAFRIYGLYSGLIKDCTFIDNTAISSGGAVRVGKASSPVFEGCSFTDNYSGESGGGLMVTGASNVTVTDCVFTNNTAAGRAGGLYIGESSSALVEGCCMEGNKSPYGGAVRTAVAADVKFIHCTIKDNGSGSGNDESRSKVGGGIYSNDVTTLEINGCDFLNNDANDFGGGLSLSKTGSSLVANCVFAGNKAADAGAGIRVYTNDATIVNCTFCGNSSSVGKAVSRMDGSPLDRIDNSIFWEGDNPIDDSQGVLEINYCDIQGGWAGAGTGNIDADPLFIDAAGVDGIVGTIDDDYHLAENSPCVNAGDNSVIPFELTKDKDGNSRVAKLVVDMGAYEIAGCGDESHPIPYGDVNGDCKVDIADLAVIASNWFVCTAPECD